MAGCIRLPKAGYTLGNVTGIEYHRRLLLYQERLSLKYHCPNNFHCL